MPRRVAVCLVALLAAACGSAAPTVTATVPVPRPSTGLLVITSGGTALTDGATDVPPTLDLRISAGDPLNPDDVASSLDGTVLRLRSDAGGALTASTVAMPLGSAHHLYIAVVGRDHATLAFSVVGPAQWMAALHTDPRDGTVLDVAFERGPDHAAVEGALAGGTRSWSDDRHLRVTWPKAPGGTLRLAESIPTARGSHLAAGPGLDLRAVAPGGVRRVTAPTAPSPPKKLLLVAFSVGTAASRAAVAAHAEQISLLSPAGLQVGGDGSLSGATDPSAVSTARSRGLAVWPLVQNQGFDSAAVSRLLHDRAAADLLVSALRAVARQPGFGGIQLDFEEVLPADRDVLSAFIATLAAALHKDGSRLAVDVIPHKPGSLNVHSAAYDLRAIAAAADLVTLMAYEQHNASTEPGAVAGLSWDRQLLGGSLSDLDASRTLLGLPLYVRTWAAGGNPADAYASAVGSAVQTAGARFDYDFAEATPLVRSGDGATTYFDDAQSLASKVALVPDQKLAGVAVWRLGFEDPAFWSLMPAQPLRI